MSSLKKSFKDHLKAAVIITLGLVVYKQISQNTPNNLSDRPENNLLTAESNILLKNLFAQTK